ncbi:acyltransferase [Lactobacillus delbrueckii]|uniref:acyltransferase family protein n=1 Tax=Lactobacillus delbrueckii TaxID=1584 RepID=UPI0022EBD0BB|nr:acyltransferase [Lactobacillus delbrueckii]MDA3802070.1 acyltransferase [Lactobacillus delbrueckii]
MNTNKFTISWGDFSRYRSSMFGLSIIGIMVFHHFEHIRSAHLLLKSEQFWDYYIGSTVVDFFLFLSGMGLFYSLTKNDDICQFYKKRLVRILPAYLLVSMPFFAWRDFIHLHTGILTFIRDLLFLNFIDHADTTYWFIFFIIVMYLLFPLLFKFLDTASQGKRFLRLLAVLAIYALFSWGLFALNPVIFGNVSIALARVPIFVLGCYFAPQIKRNDRFTVWQIVLFVLATALLMYCKYNIHFGIWLPLPYWIRLTNSLWAFPLMIIGLYLCKLINLTKFLQGFVKISGALSLELYLGHVSARIFLTAHHMSLYIPLAIPGRDRPLLPGQLLKWMENKIQGQLLPLSRKK